MRCKTFCLALLSLFLISSAFATTTIVEVKTLPHHRVFITPIAISDGFDALATPVEGFSSQYGDVKFSLDFDESSFDLNFIIKDGDQIVYSTKVREEFESGGIVDVTILPDGVDPIETPVEEVKETEKEEAEEEVEIEENSSEVEEVDSETGIEEIKKVEEGNKSRILISGYAVIEANKPVVSKVYYSLIGFIILVLAFLMVKKSGIKIKKREKSDTVNYDQELKQAKAKVSELEAKKNNRIEEVKKKLIENQKELLRLRGGESTKSDSSEGESGEKNKSSSSEWRRRVDGNKQRRKFSGGYSQKSFTKKEPKDY